MNDDIIFMLYGFVVAAGDLKEQDWNNILAHVAVDPGDGLGLDGDQGVLVQVALVDGSFGLDPGSGIESIAVFIFGDHQLVGISMLNNQQILFVDILKLVERHLLNVIVTIKADSVFATTVPTTDHTVSKDHLFWKVELLVIIASVFIIAIASDITIVTVAEVAVLVVLAVVTIKVFISDSARTDQSFALTIIGTGAKVLEFHLNILNSDVTGSLSRVKDHGRGKEGENGS